MFVLSTPGGRLSRQVVWRVAAPANEAVHTAVNSLTPVIHRLFPSLWVAVHNTCGWRPSRAVRRLPTVGPSAAGG